MDDTQALKIIYTLANGLDPTTEPPVAGPPLLQDGNVIRALYVAVRVLERTTRSRASNRSSRMPANAGKPWTEEEDRQLLERYDGGQTTIAQLAQAHDRTPAGIQARLERHGRVPGQGLKWRGRAGNTLADATRGEGPDT
jgi:hypothetical protein